MGILDKFRRRMGCTPQDWVWRGMMMKIFNLRKMKKDKSKKDVEGLIKELRHKKARVRMEAAKALGKMRDARAVEPLIQALNDEDSVVRENAALALGEMGDSRAVEPLTQAFDDKDKYERRRIVEALGRIKDSRAVELLVQALKDNDSGVRSQAAEALGEMGDKRAVEPLIQALKERYSHQPTKGKEVWTILAALCKIKGREAADVILNWIFENPIDLYDTPEAWEKYAKSIAEDIGGKRGVVAAASISFMTQGQITSHYYTVKRFFGDYGDLIFAAAGFDYKIHVTASSYEYVYDLRISDEAIKMLCKIRTPISNNLLHKIAQKRDIEVPTRAERKEFVSGPLQYGYLSFEHQRKMAAEELKRRGNIPYDPSLYLVRDEEWKLWEE